MTSFFCDLAPQLGCWLAARQMHIVMLRAVMRAPLTFFDTTPIGRIISRFAKDVDVLDTSLPPQISDTIYCLFEVIVLDAHGENSGWDSLYYFLSPYIYIYVSPTRLFMRALCTYPSHFFPLPRAERKLPYIYVSLSWSRTHFTRMCNFFRVKRDVQTVNRWCWYIVLDIYMCVCMCVW